MKPSRAPLVTPSPVADVVRHAAASFAVVALAIAGALGCGGAPAGTTCNGHDELCARRYDQVAFAGTHDAYADTDDHFLAPDQTHSLARQLSDGVRVLHVEIYPDPDTGAPALCHHVCQVGSMPLADGVKEVSDFIDAHPREVVTLLMESDHVSIDAIDGVLSSSKLAGRFTVHAKGTPWPTLGAMIDARTPVVAFLADFTTPSSTTSGRYPYLHDRFGLTVETPWDNKIFADFTRCHADRGQDGNEIYVVDTYLEDQILPTPQHATLVSDNPFLLERLLYCQREVGRLPNFVMVNYYEVSDVFKDVDVLNGFAPATGADVDAFPPAPADAAAGDDASAVDAAVPVDAASADAGAAVDATAG